jgi:hypothetical protein
MDTALSWMVCLPAEPQHVNAKVVQAQRSSHDRCHEPRASTAPTLFVFAAFVVLEFRY